MPYPWQPVREVIRKDHVVHFNNTRYRGYVYINPTDIKVIQPEITEEGLEIETIYYDNIIHICVFEGKKSLFARDMKKQDFEPLGTLISFDVRSNSTSGKLFSSIR